MYKKRPPKNVYICIHPISTMIIEMKVVHQMLISYLQDSMDNFPLHWTERGMTKVVLKGLKMFI